MIKLKIDYENLVDFLTESIKKVLKENEEFMSLIRESKGHSKEVTDLGYQIIDAMMKDLPTSTEYRKRDYMINYKENSIKVDFRNGITSITLRYTVYLCGTKDEYLDFIRYNEPHFECEYNFKNRTMTIVTCHYDGHFSEDLEEVVMHETMHMFQYDKGLEKKVDLYQRAIDLYRMSEKDIDACQIGIALYYSFQHEQDALIQQFFQFLKDNNFNSYSMEEYERAIQSFEPYKLFTNTINIVRNNHKNKRMQNAIAYLGFDNDGYMKRINIGYHRFKKKLHRAFDEHIRLYNEEHMSIEARIRRDNRLGLLEYNPKNKPKKEQYI